MLKSFEKFMSLVDRKNLRTNAPKPHNCRVEFLEERALLSAVPLSAQEYADLRGQYADFNLPENMEDMNVITLDLAEGDDLAALKAAITTAGQTIKSDLIVVRASVDASTLTYTTTSGTVSINIDSTQYGAISIVSLGDANLTLNANQKCGVMNVSGSSTVVNLGGLTIQNGKANNGGGIYNDYSTLTVTSCTISGNTASKNGGGIYNYCNYNGTANLTVTNSTISENTASSDGGGIYNAEGGTFVIINSTISGNTARWGGGIRNVPKSAITVTNSTISENTASAYGGGIYGGGTVTITNCEILENTDGIFYSDNGYGGKLMVTNSKISGNTGCGVDNSSYAIIANSEISGNTAGACGGGINNQGTLTVTDSTISGNTASGSNSYGGGIYNKRTLTVTNSTISGNTASGSNSYGGGIYTDQGTLTVTDSTISGNTASGSYGYGGGIYNKYGTLTVTNSTISGNTAFTSGSGIYSCNSIAITNSIVSWNYSNNICGSLSVDSSNNLINYYPLFVCAPVFDSEGKLANADTMDLHLRSDSSAIDKGNNAAIANIETDRGGNTRIYGDTVDIGAYEYQGDRNDEPFYSAVVKTLNDSFDFDDDEWSLREAIYYASDYVTITFAEGLEGTIVLTLGQLEIEAPLAIDGNNRITIDADQKSRVFNVSNGTEENPFVLNGLTIQNGNADNGGGIYVESGFLHVTNSTITGNTISSSSSNVYGSGIYNAGTLTVTNSTISENTGSSSSSSSTTYYAYGGGIYNSGTLTVTNSTISGNTASNYNYGGGIYNYYGILTVTNSTISENKGGGIYNYSGPLTITNCTISGNTATYGGGIYNNTGTLTATNSTISGNTASASGGGIYNYNNGPLTVTNCTIAGNIVSSSSSSASGGGIYNVSGTLTLINSIVRKNYSSNVFGTISSESSNNLIGNYYTMFVCDPLFDSNGKLTNADTMDLHLRSDSAAIDKGNNSVVADIETDLDGNARIYGDTVDLGAYEYQGDRNDEPFPYSNVVTTLNDSFDLNDDEWSLREAIYYAPEYVTITFAEGLEGTIVLTQGQLKIEAPLAIDGDNRITIDANRKNRVFYVFGGTEDAPVILDGLTIQNGKVSGNGGGIYVYSGALQVTNSTISGNTVSYSYGGGIYNYYGTLTVTNSTITGNTESGSPSTYSSNPYGGGGIYNYTGTLIINNSTILGNTAYVGGGIYNYGYNATANLTVTNSTISGNTASSYSASGGGIYNSATINLTVTNSSISENKGGGIFSDRGTANLTITNSTISGNSESGIYGQNGTANLKVTNSTISGNNGNGIYNYRESGTFNLTVTNSRIVGNNGSGIYSYGYYGTANLTVTNSTIAGNTASFGGGIYNTGTLTLTNSTIAGNTASSYGGGIYNKKGTTNVYNSIIACNTASSGNDVYKSNGTVNGYNNLSSYTGWSGSGNIEYNPSNQLFLDPENGDYRILPSSQARNQGDNTYAYAAGLTSDSRDLAGVRRFSDEHIDIGAYECNIVFVPIEPKRIVSGSLSIQKPYCEIYIFTLDAATTISFTLLQGEWENLEIKLFGMGYSEFLTPESGEFTLLEGGTYYLSFSSKNFVENQPYAFRINLHDTTDLTIGTEYQGTIPASRYAKIFKIETSETKILDLLLDAESTVARNEIYVKYNSAPTRTDYDWSSLTGNPDQSLCIDSAPAGTYYVLIYSDYCPSRSAYTLTANLTSVKLEDFVMTGVGVDKLEFLISGGGFDNTFQVYAVNTQTGTAVQG